MEKEWRESFIPLQKEFIMCDVLWFMISVMYEKWDFFGFFKTSYKYMCFKERKQGVDAENNIKRGNILNATKLFFLHVFLFRSTKNRDR